ncbi:MAG: zf-TFIIB domain-containing protein [Planctomycetaceae bacterium]
MQCPSCSSELTRSKYEGLPVFSCTRCAGYLVASKQVTNIKRRREKSPNDLAIEVDARGRDQQRIVRCPRCRRQMEKEEAKGKHRFQIDKCRDCEFVWFDPGELACLQQNFEATPRGEEAGRFQERHKTMSQTDRDEFEENLANLPPGDASLLSAFGQGLAESFLQFFFDSRRRETH